MPRITAAERSAAYFRAGKPADPPKGMTAAGRRLWREIVASKPVDWFDAGSLHILRRHCENTARADAVSRDLSRVKPGTKEFRDLAGDMRVLNLALATSGRQLRLTVQHTVDTQSGRINERGMPGGDAFAGLIGGSA